MNGRIALLSILVLQTELDTSVNNCGNVRITMTVSLTVLARTRKLKVCFKDLKQVKNWSKDCKYDACPDWTIWATWSDCIKIPSSFAEESLSKSCPPKFRLREKRRCPESEEFCSVIEEEPCACHIAQSNESSLKDDEKRNGLNGKNDIEGLSSASIGKSQRNNKSQEL